MRSGITSPFMYDGRFAIERQVVDFYNGGRIKNLHKDKTIILLNLTDLEKEDLAEFLQS